MPQKYSPEVPMPLIVALHGAGGSGASMTRMFSLGDEFGVIVLAPDSRDGRTWDAILGTWGPDIRFIRTALLYAFSRCTVERQHIGLMGISDGASYALSMGIGNGDLFGHIAAFSPGVMSPAERHGNPRIFISHGTRDTTMPIDDTSRKFVPRLKGLGYDVTYREFDGGHTVPPEIAHQAFEWFHG